MFVVKLSLLNWILYRLNWKYLLLNEFHVKLTVFAFIWFAVTFFGTSKKKSTKINRIESKLIRQFYWDIYIVKCSIQMAHFWSSVCFWNLFDNNKSLRVEHLGLLSSTYSRQSMLSVWKNSQTKCNSPISRHW